MEESIFHSIVIITFAFSIILIGLILILNKYHKSIEQKNKEIYASVIQAEENERERISRDIHDELGGLITSSRLSLGSIDLETINETDRDKIKSVIEILELASKTARNVSMELSPEAIQKYGLKGALDSLKQIYNSYKGDISIEYDIESINPHFEIALYRIVNELMNNSVKYSKSKNIKLKLWQNNSNEVHLIFEDDGIGFTYDDESITGNGIRNIKYRCELMNGKFEIITSENKGCTYKFIFKV